MTPQAFKDWRSRLGITQAVAASAEFLGRTERMIRYYESGEKEIPKSIALACWALEHKPKKRRKKPRPPIS